MTAKPNSKLIVIDSKPLTEKDIAELGITADDLFEVRSNKGITLQQKIVKYEDVLSALRLLEEKIHILSAYLINPNSTFTSDEVSGILAEYQDRIRQTIKECFQLKEVEE